MRCGADERQALELLSRYIARPALADARVQTNAAGQVVLKLKTPWRDGTTHLVRSPLEFMQRLAALVPRPRLHLIRFHGVLAPNARPEISVTPRCRPGDTQACVVRAGHKSACLLALLPACLAFAGPARAEVASEFWPEIGVFVQLNDRSRACFDAAHARGKESDVRSMDVAACLDISLKPIHRPELLSKDWQRSKYLWARIGYDRIFETTDSTGTEVAEDRGVIAIYGRVPLPASVWLETRTRADFRWLGDEQSNRYRFRVDATREFTVLDHTVVPHFNYEWIYDTRYDDWARTLWTLGAEVTQNDHFRYEIYFARQVDRLPEDRNLNAIGVVFKWYY